MAWWLIIWLYYSGLQQNIGLQICPCHIGQMKYLNISWWLIFWLYYSGLQQNIGLQSYPCYIGQMKYLMMSFWSIFWLFYCRLQQNNGLLQICQCHIGKRDYFEYISRPNILIILFWYAPRYWLVNAILIKYKYFDYILMTDILIMLFWSVTRCYLVKPNPLWY